MAHHALVMALAKVIIAAAWADGHLAEDEVNHLKRLLLRMPSLGSGPEGRLTTEEWAELDIYLHSPVGTAERGRLIAELSAVLSSRNDREIALRAIEELVAADRVVTPEEQAALAEIRRALENADLGFFAQLGRLFRGPFSTAPGPNRELMRDDFLKNRIYFAVRQRLNPQPETELGVTDDEARLLCLAGGLLAHIAAADATIAAVERETIEQLLQDTWHITPIAAALVAETALSEVARSIDFFQLTNEFRTSAPRDLRLRFLDAAFAVAAADGRISSEESAEISRIAQSVGLIQEEFVAAKMRQKQ